MWAAMKPEPPGACVSQGYDTTARIPWRDSPVKRTLVMFVGVGLRRSVLVSRVDGFQSKLLQDDGRRRVDGGLFILFSFIPHV